MPRIVAGPVGDWQPGRTPTMWISNRSWTDISPTLPRGHIPSLDALRGIAVLAVLLYHFGSHTAPEGNIGRLTSTLIRLGGSGVDLFFVLSGFLITGILYDSKGRGRYFRDFYVRRSLRIFPLYYLVLIGGLLVLPAVGVKLDAGPGIDRPWLWVYGTNAVQATRGAYVFGWFDHFWSLAVEEHFYLVWPLVIATLGRRAAMGVSVGCVATALVSRWTLVASGDHAIAAYVATPCRLDALAVGAFLALAARGPGGISLLWRWATPNLLASGALLAWLVTAKSDLGAMDRASLVLRFTLTSWFFGALLILAVVTPTGSGIGRCLNSRWLRFFGTYSYGLYIFHYPLIPLFLRSFPVESLQAQFGSSLVGTVAFLALCIGSTLAVALMSWHLWEKHFLKLKDRFAPRAGDSGRAQIRPPKPANAAQIFRPAAPRLGLNAVDGRIESP